MPEVELRFPGGYKTSSMTYGFEVRTDYPKYLGGENSAPAPWDLFLVSLTACQGIHIRTWCAENGIPTDGIRLTLDQTASKGDPNRFTDFDLNIYLPADFPEDKKEGLLAAARSCRVVKHLTEHPVRVNQHIIAEK